MDKNELDKILEKLEKLEKVIGNLATDNLDKEIERAFYQSASISIDKKEDGNCDIHFNGTKLSILITLAGLEQGILERTHTPKELWELIKRKTGSREAKENE